MYKAMAKTKKSAPKTSAKKETAPVKEETPVEATPAEETTQQEIPFDGGIAPEIPKENLKVDVVETDKDALPLQDKVLVSNEDLPAVDTVDSSIYEEDIELLSEEPAAPVKEDNTKREWVSDPKLLRKTEGFKDTLVGTLYKGVRK